MDIEKIIRQSATIYSQWLSQNNRGIVSYGVKSIENVNLGSTNSTIYRIHLNSKLNSLDHLQIQIRTKIYDKHHMSIMLYDEEKRQLTVSLSNLILKENQDFEKINPDDIKIVYDLIYLTDRVKKWFEINQVYYPLKKDLFFNDESKIEIFTNCSEEQRKAVITSLTSPLSYVWGAPGTGKTQYVLTNAVLNYTKQNEKVIIVAPTNNALEQVLSSVIKVIDELKIDRNKIIRLGTPTKEFFSKYSEVCEDDKIDSILKLIDSKKDLYRGLLNYKTNAKNYDKYSKIISNKLEDIENRINENQDIFDNIKDNKKELEILNKKYDSLILSYDGLVSDKNSAIDKTKSLITKISFMLNSKKKNLYKKELLDLENKEKELLEQIESNKKETKAIKDKIKQLESKINRIDLNVLKKDLDKLNISYFELEDEFISTKQNIFNELRKIKTELSHEKELYKEYENDDEQQIKQKVEEALKEREETLLKTTQARVETALIIGTTIDNFIGSQLPSDDPNNKDVLDLDARHIFLDEAGYSSLAKSLALFSKRIPVTLFGDHFQLSPVCELDDNEIYNFNELVLWIHSSLYILDFFNNGIKGLIDKHDKNLLPDFRSLNKVNLTLTYRFGQNLLDILSENVYNLKMKSAPNKDNIEIYYINSPRNSISDKKRENKDEIKSIYNYLLSHKNEDISVLTPYKNQVFELKKKCFFLSDSILTIHGSQGREWDTVMLSVCDTNDKYFTDSNNKNSGGKLILNTAISRVKKKLIIVCDYNYWISQHGQLIYEILKIAKPY